MKVVVITLIFFGGWQLALSRKFDLDAERNSFGYCHLKDSIIQNHKIHMPGNFGTFVKGVKERVMTPQKNPDC